MLVNRDIVIFIFSFRNVIGFSSVGKTDDNEKTGQDEKKGNKSDEVDVTGGTKRTLCVWYIGNLTDNGIGLYDKGIIRGLIV